MTQTLTNTRTSQTLQSHLNYVQSLMERNGPDVSEYEAHLAWYDHLNELVINGDLSKTEIDQIRNTFGRAYLSQNTIQGLMYTKPHGYAGDFEIIEKLYAEWVSDDPLLRKFDLFCQAQAAPKSVRNRKTYFKQLLLDKCAKYDRPVQVLNLASGPCRGIFELLEEDSDLNFQIYCIDIDPKAITHAKQLLKSVDIDEKVTFEEANIFRYQPVQQYDLIWSAGLFDYFNDKAFVRILSRYIDFIAADGEIVVGNFHPRNSTRSYMEVIGEWYLHHRTEVQLTELAIQAGADAACIRIDEEAEGVNLFMRIGG